MNILLKWLTLAIAIIISAYLIPGVTVGGFWAAVWVALALGIINVTIKPLLIILTLPINILTLGLFLLVINALMIMLAARIVPSFEVKGFWVALGFSIVVSVFSYLLNHVFGIK